MGAIAGQYASAARYGARLRAARKQQRLTLQEVATRTGFSHQHVSQAEFGKVNTPIETLVKIATALDMTMEDVVCDVPPLSRPA